MISGFTAALCETNININKCRLRDGGTLADELQEWDHTNFLVDLSGHYANCDRVRTSGEIHVDRQTPEGDRIVGFVDNIDGSATDVDAVNGYIRSLVDRWTRARTYDSMVSHNTILDL